MGNEMEMMQKKLDLILGTMATKSDIANMATKDDLSEMASKADLVGMATKADLSGMATKSDLHRLEKEIKDIRHYVEHIDTELQEHRHDSEVHRKVGV